MRAELTKRDKELALIKEFSTGHERIHFIEEVLHEVLRGNDCLAEYFRFINIENTRITQQNVIYCPGIESKT